MRNSSSRKSTVTRGQEGRLTTFGDLPKFIWLLLPMFPWEGPPLPRFLPGWPWTWRG